MDWTRSIYNQLKQEVCFPSISTGFGILVRFSGIRLEVNYCFPIALNHSDKFKHGIQFGLGMNFM